MARLMAVLIYGVLTAIGALVMVLAVQGSRTDAENQLRSEVEMAYQTFGPVMELRQLQLRDVASDLADGEVGAWLAVLEARRHEMLGIEADVYRQFPGDIEDEALQTKRREAVAGKTVFVDGFIDDLTARVEHSRGGREAWAKVPKRQFQQDAREALIRCNAYAVNNCFFRMTWYPLKERVDAIRQTAEFGVQPDLVVITDTRGTGLADADRPKWSDDSRFAERHPLVREVRKKGVLRDMIRIGPRAYLVTAAPIYSDGLFRGSVLVGMEIDDKLLQAEVKAQGLQVSYLDGRNLIRSTLSAAAQKELLGAMPGRGEGDGPQMVDSSELVSQIIPLVGNYSNRDVRVALSAVRSEVFGPARFLTQMVILYGFLAFLLGLGLAMWMRRQSTKPLVAVDSGIHEIIGGNYEYEFPHAFKDELWNAMAQSLNRMVGLLLGRDAEEGEALNDDWARTMLRDETISGKALPADAGDPDAQDAPREDISV